MSKQTWYVIGSNGKRTYCVADTRDQAIRILGDGSVYAETREEWLARFEANSQCIKDIAATCRGYL